MAIAAWSYPFQKTFKLAQGPLVPCTWEELILKPGHFVIQPFWASETSCFAISLQGAILVDDLTLSLDSIDLPISPAPVQAVLPQYDKLVGLALNALEGGGLHKVVLSRYADHAIGGFQTNWPMRLRLAYPGAFIALVSDPLLGTWITASPELFLARNREMLSSFSLAGTRLSSSGILGDKERNEQQIVTKYIKHVFEKHGIEAVVKPTTEYQAGQVAHLLNEVGGCMRGELQLDLAGLIQDLHPTPAVGGFPKLAALRFIQEMEGYERGLYTGFMGEFAHETDFRFYVVLRCARIFHTVLRCFAGGGIVPGSLPKSELAETEAKMDVIRRVLLSLP